MSEITAEELIGRYNAGERDFSKLDLRGIKLEEVDLRGINLEGADLRGTSFCYCDLQGAVLRNANLEEADLYLTTLVDTDFRGANLRRSNTLETDLTRANFEGAIVENPVGGAFGGYTYNTILPDGRVDSCPDPGRDKAISEGLDL